MSFREKIQSISCCQIDETLKKCDRFLCSDSDDDKYDESGQVEATPRISMGSTTTSKWHEEENLKFSNKKELIAQKAKQMASDLKTGLQFSLLTEQRKTSGTVMLSPRETTLIFIFNQFRTGDQAMKDFTMSFKTVEEVHTFDDKRDEDWPSFVSGLSATYRDCFLAIVDNAPPLYIILESPIVRDNFIYFLNSKTALNLPDPKAPLS